jgi:hypothetical protein
MRLNLLALTTVLLACAAPRPAPAREAPARSGPYAVELTDEAGRVLPTYQHRGRTYVLGALGTRYLIRVTNGSGRRAEVVVSVDGRDVIDGRPAGFEKRGYLVEPRGEVTIDGFRLDAEAVAAFRFSSVPRSYAALKGDARDVGVIGVAVFPERAPRYVPPPRDPPYVPYSSERDEAEDRGAAPAAPRSEPAPSARREGPGEAEAQAQAQAKSTRRPGLGTEFGEAHDSHVDHVQFERASAQPQAVLTLRYDDRPGLLALGIDLDRRWRAGADERWMRETADPFRRNPGYAEPPSGWRP